MAAAPRSLQFAALAMAVVMAALALAVPTTMTARETDARGFRVLSGAEAARFEPPRDTQLIRRFSLPGLDLEVERYQQVTIAHQALVDGGQLTVYRRGNRAVLVIGAHYPQARARNRLQVDEDEAVEVAATDRRLERGKGLRPQAGRGDPPALREAALRLDPHTGRLFYRVETSDVGIRQLHWVDAETGRVFHAIDAVTDDRGTGVKLDTKSLVAGPGSADDLTTRPGAAWRMHSADGRLAVYDGRNGWGIWAFPTDSDNLWTSAYQRPAVDAQFYARATDNYLRQRFSFDLIGGCAYNQIGSIVHVGSHYANAFWDGRYVHYGDGDGAQFRALSGAQDVVTHELVHALTECTSDLLYQNEPGALNEAFSDILATAAEHAIGEANASNCRRAAGQQVCADWWIAEDALIGAGPHGIRSLANPAAGDQPSHYDALYRGPMDNGGVHINSGIPNHAFYLMSEGGRNARCTGARDGKSDCDVLVPRVGIDDAARIAFATYIGLPDDASFCTARSATIATARALFRGSARHAAAATLAWDAVGLTGARCADPAADFTLTADQRTLHARPGGPPVALAVALDRTVAGPDVGVTVTGVPDGWYSVSSSGSATGSAVVEFTVPAGAADGVHGALVTAASATHASSAAVTLVVDAIAPAVTAPAVALPMNAVVPQSGGLPVGVTWSASDATSGVADNQLQLSTGGGAWLPIPTVAGAAGSSVVLVGPGAHRLRVQATDAAGNTATSPPSSPFTIAGLQESAARFSAGWSAQPATQSWGSTRYATTSDRTATVRFFGQEVAWVAHTGPKRGKARVYIDGVLAGRVNLYAPAAGTRVVVFTASGLKAGVEHRLRVVTVATASRPRVDVDGFLVLSR